MIVLNDPIVEETRAARAELHDEFADNRAGLFEYLKRIEGQNAERVVKLHARPAQVVVRRVS